MLCCRKRDPDASLISRRDFLPILKAELKEAFQVMTQVSKGRSPVASVDLSQVMIGPDMAVFSRYAQVLDVDGTPMSVKTVLQYINRFLTDGDFDNDTQCCIELFKAYG